MNDSLTTLHEYLLTSSHWYENSVKGMENWAIGPDCIFKTKEQLKEYSDNCYQTELRECRSNFSKFCLENNILNADANLFEEFFNFNQVSPWVSGICTAVCVEIDDIDTPEKTEILGQPFAVTRAYDLFKQFFSHSFDDIDCAREVIQ